MRLHPPSPAFLVSVVALTVALSGTSYAVVTLDKNSVHAKQIARNAVRASEIKAGAVRSPEVLDGTLRAEDFAPGQIPAGQQGPKGDKGDVGPAGPFPDVLPSGRTLTGVFGLYGHGEEDGGLEIASGDISFTFPLATAPQVKVVQNGTASLPPECPGTALAPAAAPGWLCVYENRAQNQRGDVPYPTVSAPGSGGSPSASRFGASIHAQGQAAGTGWFYWSEGTWAVTAP